jgi:squalene-hopene/tetraprenyl-beta-curcumene cyclase
MIRRPVRTWFAFGVTAAALALVLAGPALVGWSADQIPSRIGPDPKQYDEVVAKAIHYLRTKGQAEDGSYRGATSPAVTALITTGILRSGRPVDDPLVAKSLKYLEGFVQPDGGVYETGSLYRNYETCLAILCFTEANKDGRYTERIAAADKFIRQLQWGEGLEDSDRRIGGAGYGRQKRPDMSNTSYFIEALRAAGAGPDDPAIQAALKFVSQCQNLESEHNTGPTAAKNPDGGFVYTPDSSQAGDLPNGGLRSYASMTYAGLKSMIYAGIGPDDPRVKAAATWVQKHYDLEQNPGMGSSGLYYYYHTFAKALDSLGHDLFEDAQGVKHDWRRELVDVLAREQNADGSWTNKDPRWLEGDPNLVTGYVLMALHHCRPKQSNPASE